MTNSKSLFQDFIKRIKISEDASELESIALVAFEEIFGFTRTELLLNKTITVNNEQAKRLEQFLERINTHEPIQHILGYAHFMGQRFIVNRDVLIPRPETEELVTFVLKYLQKIKTPKILDIATGSGCIPISLSLERNDSDVYGTDVSELALTIAKTNNQALKAKVNFLKHDILREEIPMTNLDVIISNPPYIAFSEKDSMQKQVVDFEPHLALFVSDDDPLIFYRIITMKGFPALNPGGILAMEINQRFGKDVSALFESAGFKNVAVHKDISGNDRIVVGVKD